ncbi:MAG: hypothetical protein K6F78_05745 [Bacteroidaceae bacterium]|nr:hypothetical protein [Bacteroidaceae bacterium]
MGTLLVLFSALMLVACQEKPVSPDTPYIIEGYVPSIKDGVEIKMYQYYGDLIAKDTIESRDYPRVNMEDYVKLLSSSNGDCLSYNPFGRYYSFLRSNNPGIRRCKVDRR